MGALQLITAGASILTSLSAADSAADAAEKEAEMTRRAAARKKAAAELEATVLETQAGQQIAASQRDMLDLQRAARLAQSRTTAIAAASGGGATAPTVVKLIGDLAKEGSYNAARALYSGEEKARLMKLQAFQKRIEGEFATESGEFAALAAESRGEAAQMSSFGTILNTASGLFSKYGGGGPSGTGSIGGSLVGDFPTLPSFA